MCTKQDSERPSDWDGEEWQSYTIAELIAQAEALWPGVPLEDIEVHAAGNNCGDGCPDYLIRLEISQAFLERSRTKAQ